MDSNVAKRVGFAVVAIPAFLGVVYLGGLPLALLLAIAAALGARELCLLAEHKGVRPLTGLAMLTSAAIPVIGYHVVASPDWLVWGIRWGALAMALWLIGALVMLLRSRSPQESPLAAVAVTSFAPLYTGLLPTFALPIQHAGSHLSPWAGVSLLAFPMVVTWVCDTAAMFGGRAMKGPKLAPTVSPGKTRSGALAGVVGALLVVPLWWPTAFAASGVAMPLWQGMVIAGAIGVVGQLGDLAESLFKREAGVKDSSNLIPGHGGVLDRLDSLYFVIPLAAALYRAFGVW